MRDVIMIKAMLRLMRKHAQMSPPTIILPYSQKVVIAGLQVPWDDLRYIFGEIMYGGHIVEDWDRRLANAYLYKYFNEALLESQEFFPGFTPPPSSCNHRQVGSKALLSLDHLCRSHITSTTFHSPWGPPRP
jgi:hypothetical protein